MRHAYLVAQYVHRDASLGPEDLHARAQVLRNADEPWLPARTTVKRLHKLTGRLAARANGTAVSALQVKAL